MVEVNLLHSPLGKKTMYNPQIGKNFNQNATIALHYRQNMDLNCMFHIIRSAIFYWTRVHLKFSFMSNIDPETRLKWQERRKTQFGAVRGRRKRWLSVVTEEGGAIESPAALFSAQETGANGNSQMAISTARKTSYLRLGSRVSSPRFRRATWRRRISIPRWYPLHYAAESYLVRVFEDANLIARHTKRITIYSKDIC